MSRRNDQTRRAHKPGEEPWRLVMHGGPLDGYKLECTEYGTARVRERGFITIKQGANGYLYRADEHGIFRFVERVKQ